MAVSMASWFSSLDALAASKHTNSLSSPFANTCNPLSQLSSENIVNTENRLSTHTIYIASGKVDQEESQCWHYTNLTKYDLWIASILDSGLVLSVSNLNLNLNQQLDWINRLIYLNKIFINCKLVQGKCPCLVAAEHIHSSHLLNGSHALCNSTLCSSK